MFVAKWYKS